MRFLVLFLFIFSSLVCKEGSTPKELADLQGHPSNLAFDCINVTTGDLVFKQEDAHVTGAHPLPFPRHYVSGEETNKNLQWDPQKQVVAISSGESKFSPITSLTIPISNGVTIDFQLVRKNKKELAFQPFFISSGISSYCYDSLGAPFHPLNTVAKLGKGLVLELPTGEKRVFEQGYKILSGSDDTAEMTRYFFLRDTHLTNGTVIAYDYHRKSSKNLQLRRFLSVFLEVHMQNQALKT